MKRSASSLRCFIKEFSLRNVAGEKVWHSQPAGPNASTKPSAKNTKYFTPFFTFSRGHKFGRRVPPRLPSAAPRWVTLNESRECGFAEAPTSERLRLLLPPPGCITWLVLGWLSAVLTAWPPGGLPAKCHVTSGSASPPSGPQSFSHPHPPLTPPCPPPPFHLTPPEKEKHLFVSLYLWPLCSCTV